MRDDATLRDEVTGNVVAFEREGRRLVGCWIGRGLRAALEG